MPGARGDRRGSLMGSIASVPLIGTVTAADMKIQEKTTGSRIAGNREIKMGQGSFALRRMKLN